MADARKRSFSKLSFEELLLEKKEIEREIKSRIQSQQQTKPPKKQLSAQSFLVTTKDASLQPATQAKVKQFLQFIIYGDQAAAEKMLADNEKLLPILLTQKVEVTDYSGRKILGTALQLAFGAKDVRYHENEICMVEMLQKYYNKLPDGEAVMAAQTLEQFPEGWEAQEKARQDSDSAALNKMVAAIASSTSDQECDKALQDFIKHLRLQTTNTIKTGYHCNDQLLMEAFKLYDQNYERFGGWGSRKNNYCWQKVIGNIERYLTACEAQAMCQGIYNIVEGKEKLTRSLTFRYDPAVKFYPLDADPRFRLGHEYATGLRWFADLSLGPWKIMSDKKQQHCETLRNSFANLRRDCAP